MKTHFLPALMLAWLPLPVVAHVHLAPESAARGAVIDLALVVGHGCAGQATTALRLSVPPALADVSVPDKPGWSVTTKAGEVIWQGGPLADHDKTSFVLRATIAADAPDRLTIPVIQTCGTAETRWIETGSGADSPAPVLQITPAK